MKKLLCLIACAAVAAGAVSCKKSSSTNTQAPSITWGISGDTVEIGSKEDSNVNISIPEGVEACTIEVVLPSIEINTILNANYISIKDNYATTNINGKTVEVVNGILDLVNDSKSSSALSLGNVKAATTLTLNLAKVVNTLMSGYNAKDGEVFTFNIAVTDAVGKEAKKSVNFHWTAEPALVWLDESTVLNQKDVFPLSQSDLPLVPGASFKITAPAIIETFTITVKSNNSAMMAPVQIYGESDPSIPGGILLDLINGQKVLGLDFGVEVGEKLKVAETTISLASVLRSMIVFGDAESTIQLTFKIMDAFERTLTTEINYVIK